VCHDFTITCSKMLGVGRGRQENEKLEGVMNPNSLCWHVRGVGGCILCLKRMRNPWFSWSWIVLG
jgi:hypothetical protein